MKDYLFGFKKVWLKKPLSYLRRPVDAQVITFSTQDQVFVLSVAILFQALYLLVIPLGFECDAAMYFRYAKSFVGAEGAGGAYYRAPGFPFFLVLSGQLLFISFIPTVVVHAALGILSPILLTQQKIFTPHATGASPPHVRFPFPPISSINIDLTVTLLCKKCTTRFSPPLAIHYWNRLSPPCSPCTVFPSVSPHISPSRPQSHRAPFPHATRLSSWPRQYFLKPFILFLFRLATNAMRRCISLMPNR